VIALRHVNIQTSHFDNKFGSTRLISLVRNFIEVRSFRQLCRSSYGALRLTACERRIKCCGGIDCAQTITSLFTLITLLDVNSLECEGNYSATSNNMKLVLWLLMGGLLHFQRGGDWAGRSPRSLLAVPNVNGRL